MNTYKFKTNINCSGCVASVTPHLNSNRDIKNWKVDTTNPNKLLTVESENLNEGAIKSLVEKAGYKAEKMGQ
ncbi:MAG: heavy-metal-associated domain-containing protein [Ginsengibacter sp.]